LLSQATRKDRAWIAAHIPHQGSMCLLDEVVTWTADQIRCRCSSHRSADNPLRAHGRLAAVCGIEIAAQAIAVHGALLAPAPPATRLAGYLVGVRNVVLHVTRLDDITDDLTATANRIGGDEATILYEFDLRAGSRPLVAGRAMIVIGGGAPGENP